MIAASLRLPVLLAGAVLALPHALPAHGLVVQGTGDGITVPAAVSDAFGRWGGNAGAIAVAPEWVLTTRHQDVLASPPNRTVVLGGTSYTALAAGVEGVDVVTLNQDLRLVRVQNTDGSPATLGTTLQVATSPLTAGAALTLGGYGPGLGSPGVDGFDYAGTLNNSNPLRFGTNTLDAVAAIDDPGEFYDGMGVLVADFSDTGSPEATAGPGDSGGAWLIDDGGTLKITGLTFAVEATRDDDPATTGVDESSVTDAFFTQLLYAVDATAFATTINTIPEPSTALLAAAFGGLLLLRRRPA